MNAFSAKEMDDAIGNEIQLSTKFWPENSDTYR